MHEYSLVDSLLRRVEDEVRRHGATRVDRVKVSVGELAGVEPDLLTAAYDLARQGTVCADAPLELVRYPARWSCPRCNRPFAHGEVLHCEPCDAPARLDERSEALLLDSLDLEVP